MRRLLVALAVLAPSIAWADSLDKATAGRLADQVAALNAGDARAFAATFVDGGIAILPGATEEGYTTAAIETAVKHWLGTLGKQTFTVGNARYGGEMVGGWYCAELATKDARFRITGVVTAADSKVLAVHISAAVDDKAAFAAAAGGKLPALAAIPDRADDGWGDLDAEDATRTKWTGAGVVIGSGPSEVAFGKAGVAAMARWKKLTFEGTKNFARRKETVRPLELYVVASHIAAVVKTDGKAVKIPYRVLLVYTASQGYDGGNTSIDKLLIAHYSVATR